MVAVARGMEDGLSRLVIPAGQIRLCLSSSASSALSLFDAVIARRDSVWKAACLMARALLKGR